jgi:hypothetical protein
VAASRRIRSMSSRRTCYHRAGARSGWLRSARFPAIRTSDKRLVVACSDARRRPTFAAVGNQDAQARHSAPSARAVRPPAAWIRPVPLLRSERQAAVRPRHQGRQTAKEAPTSMPQQSGADNHRGEPLPLLCAPPSKLPLNLECVNRAFGPDDAEEGRSQQETVRARVLGEKKAD